MLHCLHRQLWRPQKKLQGTTLGNQKYLVEEISVVYTAEGGEAVQMEQE